MLEAFLQRLADEAGKGLSASESEALVTESRAHLEDSIQARLELGQSFEEAQREAIAAFGSTKALADAVRLCEPKIDRPLAFASLGILASFTLLCRDGANEFLVLVATLSLVVAHVVFLTSAFQARRFPIRTAVLLSGALWLSASLIDSTVRGTDLQSLRFDFYGSDYRRAEIPSRIRSLEARIQAERRQAEALVMNYARYARAETGFAPGASQSGQGWTNLRSAPSAAVADERWRTAMTSGMQGIYAEIAAEEATAYELSEAEIRPWWMELPYAMARNIVATVLALAGYSVLYSAVWMVGRMLRETRLRRRRPPTID